MSDDPFTALVDRLGEEAADNAVDALGFLDRPMDPDDVVAPGRREPAAATLRQLVARELMRLESEGVLGFNPLVRPQVHEAASAGTFSMRGSMLAAPDGTLLTILALALRQTARPNTRTPPFYVLSLFRAKGGHSPHDHGLGIDVSRYNGIPFHGPTLESFRATVMLVRNLPPRTFELGLPRVPRETWHDFARYRRFRIDGQLIFRQDLNTPQFSAPFRARVPLSSELPGEVWTGPSEFLRPDLEIRRSPSRRGLAQDLAFFEHPGLALQFRHAVDESEGTIRLVFPDEPNHVPITVDIGGAWSRVLQERRPRRRGGAR